MKIFSAPTPSHAWSLTRSDSIENFFSKNPSIAEQLKSFDPVIASAVENAYAELGRLHLLRRNREDIQNIFIKENIQAYWVEDLREEICEEIFEDEKYPIEAKEDIEVFQKTRANMIQKVFEEILNDENIINQGPVEAYCEEHAYLLLAALLRQGVAENCLRVVNLNAETDKTDEETHEPILSTHVYVIYNARGFNKEEYFDISVLPVITNAPEHTLFLDAWSKEKIHTFDKNTTKEDFQSIFEKMLKEVHPRTILSTLEVDVCSYSSSDSFELDSIDSEDETCDDQALDESMEAESSPNEQHLSYASDSEIHHHLSEIENRLRTLDAQTLSSEDEIKIETLARKLKQELAEL